MKLGLLALLLGSCWSASGAVIGLAVVPASMSVVTGQSLDFNLQISGHVPGSAPSVGAFDLTVAFDGALLTPTAETFGPFLGDPTLLEALTSSMTTATTVNVAEVSLLSPTSLDVLQPASFSLATLTFTAKTSGTAALTLMGGVVDDAFGNKLVSIPEPRTLGIVGLMVLGLIVLRLRSVRSWIKALTT